MKIRLVPNWKQLWRAWSMQAMTLSVIIIGAWDVMPGSLRGYLPDWLGAAAAIVTLLLGIAGRAFTQDKITEKAGE